MGTETVIGGGGRGTGPFYIPTFAWPPGGPFDWIGGDGP